MSDTSRMMPHSYLTWPFRMLWWVAGCLIHLTGCLLAVGLGILFMAIGLLLISSFFGAIIGIPLFILGTLLLIRGLF